MRVFDPDNPEKTFIMEAGRLVELSDFDVELGGQFEMIVLEAETRPGTEENYSLVEIAENDVGK